MDTWKLILETLKIAAVPSAIYEILTPNMRDRLERWLRSFAVNGLIITAASLVTSVIVLQLTFILAQVIFWSYLVAQAPLRLIFGKRSSDPLLSGLR